MTQALASKNFDAYLEALGNSTVLPKKEPLPVYDSPYDREFWDDVRKTNETVAVGGQEVVLAPAGMGAQYCLECKNFLPADNPLNAIRPTAMLCPNCKSRCQDGLVGVGLKKEFQSLLNKSEVKKARWFHTSNFPNWEEHLGGDESHLVHLGSLDAALDRHRDIKHNEKHRSRYSNESYLYEVELVEDCEVHDSIHDDDPYNEVSPPKISDSAEEHPKVELSGVTRYVNHFEDPGSISLLANTKKFRILSKQKLS